MSRPLQFTAATRADIADAYDWYEEQRTGLGEEFRSELNVAFTLLSEFSEAGPTVHLNVRRLLLRRFPYAVYFRVVGAVIEVRGCLHLHRDPRAWHQRTEA